MDRALETVLDRLPGRMVVLLARRRKLDRRRYRLRLGLRLRTRAPAPEPDHRLLYTPIQDGGHPQRQACPDDEDSGRDRSGMRADRNVVAVAGALENEGWSTSVERSEGVWLVVATRSRTLTLDVVRETRARLAALASEHRGLYDGWEAPTG
jgi:hypothetical protein